MVWTIQWFAVTSSQRNSLPTLELDKSLDFLTYFLVDFDFCTLFAVLFGLGFAMQLSRTSKTGQSFLPVSDKAILRWAVCLALLTSLMPFLHSIGLIDVIAHEPADGMSTATRFAALTSGNWSDIVAVNASFMREHYTQFEVGFDSTLYLYLSVLWKFLIGFVIGRRMLLQNAGEHISVYRRGLPLWASPGMRTLPPQLGFLMPLCQTSRLYRAASAGS